MEWALGKFEKLVESDFASKLDNLRELRHLTIYG
jgi:hypothetical protein